MSCAAKLTGEEHSRDGGEILGRIDGGVGGVGSELAPERRCDDLELALAGRADAVDRLEPLLVPGFLEEALADDARRMIDELGLVGFDFDKSC